MHVNTYYSDFGGAEVTTNKQIKIAESAGHTTGIVYLVENKLTNEMRSNNTRFSIMISPDKSYEYFINRLIQVLQDEKPDIVHYHNLYPLQDVMFDKRLAAGNWASILHEHSSVYSCLGGARFRESICRPCFATLGFKCIISAALTRCVFFRNPFLLYKRLNKFKMLPDIWRNAYLLAPSKAVALALEKTGFQQNKIKIINNYVDVPNDYTEPSGNTILFVGRLVKEKGLQDVIDIIAGLPANLRICGTGSYENILREKVLALKIQNQVTFLGNVDRSTIEKEYRAARFVVFPTRIFEAFGNVGLEAFAQGRPVIAYDSGGNRDWLINEENGFLIASGNKRMLKKKVFELLRDEKKVTNMGRAGHKSCKDLFNYNRYKDQLLSLYTDATNKKCNIYG